MEELRMESLQIWKQLMSSDRFIVFHVIQILGGLRINKYWVDRVTSPKWAHSRLQYPFFSFIF